MSTHHFLPPEDPLQQKVARSPSTLLVCWSEFWRRSTAGTEAYHSPTLAPNCAIRAPVRCLPREARPVVLRLLQG